MQFAATEPLTEDGVVMRDGNGDSTAPANLYWCSYFETSKGAPSGDCIARCAHKVISPRAIVYCFLMFF